MASRWRWAGVLAILLVSMPTAAAAAAAGPRIAFRNGDAQHGQVVTVALDGTGRRAVPQASGDDDGAPAWSPDATLVAFERRSGGGSRLMVAAGDGTAVRQVGGKGLNAGAGGGAVPAWAPDGGSLAGFGGDGVFSVPLAAGSSPRRLASLDSGAIGVRLAWSPDGGSVAFTEDSGTDGPSRYQVRAVDAGGGGGGRPRRLAASPVDPEAAWSPDGQWLAWIGAGGALLVAPAAGGPARTVTPATVCASQPAWAPDSATIAFSGGSLGGSCAEDVFVVHPDGTDLHRLLVVGTDDSQPAWTPDGRAIVFTGRPTVRASGTSPGDLYAVDATGSPPRRITSTGVAADPAVAAAPAAATSGAGDATGSGLVPTGGQTVPGGAGAGVGPSSGGAVGGAGAGAGAGSGAGSAEIVAAPPSRARGHRSGLTVVAPAGPGAVRLESRLRANPASAGRSARGPAAAVAAATGLLAGVVLLWWRRQTAAP
jgi:Tol biopolymer transport system component